MNNMKKNDIYLIVIILLISLATAVLFQVFLKQDGAVVLVTVNGEEYGKYSLNDNQSICIESNNGQNILVIQDGAAYMAEASCPDHVCVNTGRISAGGEVIVCLPNQVIVTVVSSYKGEYDEIAK